MRWNDFPPRHRPSGSTGFPEAAAARSCRALRRARYSCRLAMQREARCVARQYGIEPERRMVRWIVDNHLEPTITPGPWMQPDEAARILAAGPSGDLKAST